MTICAYAVHNQVLMMVMVIMIMTFMVMITRMLTEHHDDLYYKPSDGV